MQICQSLKKNKQRNKTRKVNYAETWSVKSNMPHFPLFYKHNRCFSLLFCHCCITCDLLNKNTLTHKLVSRGQGERGAAGHLAHLWPSRLTLIWSHLRRHTHVRTDSQFAVNPIPWNWYCQMTIGSSYEQFSRLSSSAIKHSLLIMINTLRLISVNLPHSLCVGLQIEK